MASLFTKIINRELPAEFVYEDDLCVAIKDIQPTAPIHLLIIPKKEVRSIADASKEDQNLLGHLILVARKIAEQLNVADHGFRLVINTNADAGQTVFHLHMHFIAGQTLPWP